MIITMKNTNIKNLNISNDFLYKINIEEINKTIEYLETQECNENEWITLKDSIAEIKKEILNE